VLAYYAHSIAHLLAAHDGRPTAGVR
jgi:hypothetical protein